MQQKKYYMNDIDFSVEKHKKIIDNIDIMNKKVNDLLKNQIKFQNYNYYSYDYNLKLEKSLNFMIKKSSQKFTNYNFYDTGSFSWKNSKFEFI